MSDVTHILSAIEAGDPHAAEELLRLVYDELRTLAAAKLAQERPGQTLPATALVHEAHLRLVDTDQVQRWNSHGHFFTAAVEAMRRILIENARRKKSDKRGGQWTRVTLEHADMGAPGAPDEFLLLDEILERLTEHDPMAGKLVKLRYYAGLSLEQAADSLGILLAAA